MSARLLLSVAALIVVIAVSSIPSNVYAITVTQTTDVDTIKNALLTGLGIDMDSVVITLEGDPLQFGTFVNPTTTYGIGDGVVMSSGNVNHYNDGPNTSPDWTTGYGVPATPEQEALLDPITGGTFNHFDVAVMRIKFDMLPGYDKIYFNVVFGSEEYDEYVGSSFIDGFGMYVNGVNVAYVGGLPVNINHPEMEFVAGTELDGILGGSDGIFGEYVHTFSASVNPKDNELIFIVADTSDDELDTTVYISHIGGIPPGYDLILLEDGTPSDGEIYLGEDITAKATTNDPSIQDVTFRWIDPSNNVARTNTVNIVDGEASDTYTPDQVGTWRVVAEFSDGTTIVHELFISFQVVPESIIGAVAVIGSSLAVLALYRRKRAI